MMIMKRIGLLILSSLALSSMAQELSFKQNSIVGMDSLQLKQVSLKEFNIKGDEEGWSLKDITLSKKGFKIKYADGKDTIVVREPRGRMTYWQTERGISIIGTAKTMQRK